MKTYDKYKASGIEWIGEIPEHWEVSRFKFWANYQKGKMPSFIDFESKNDSPIYLSMDFLRGSNSQVQYAINYEGCTIIEKNDTLLLWDGANAGEFMKGKNGVLSSTMVKIIPSQNLNKNYCWFALQTFEIELRKATYGMGIPHVNTEFLKNSFQVLPPISEQTAIANYLDEKTTEIDQTIADKEELIKLYEEEKKALINEAVTKGLNPSVKLKPSSIDWLGDIPEHWFYAAIKRVVDTKVTDGPHESPEFLEYGVPFVSAEAIKENKIDFNSCRGYISIEQDEIYSKKCKPKIGDILLVKSGSTTGKSAIVETDLNFNIWSPLALIRANEKIISYKNLHYSILSEQFRNLIELFWSFGTQPNIGMNVIENLKIAIPPIEEQTQIVEYIERETTIINEKINTTQQEIALLKEYRQALIFEAVTGKICVL